MDLIVLNDGIFFHKIISIILLSLIIFNLLFLVFASKKFILINKIMWYTTPIIFGLLAILLTSGLSLLSMMKFNINIFIAYMLFVNIVIIVLEIKRIKKIRKVRANVNLRDNYIKYAMLLYHVYFLLILLCYIRLFN